MNKTLNRVRNTVPFGQGEIHVVVDSETNVGKLIYVTHENEYSILSGRISSLANKGNHAEVKAFTPNGNVSSYASSVMSLQESEEEAPQICYINAEAVFRDGQPTVKYSQFGVLGSLVSIELKDGSIIKYDRNTSLDARTNFHRASAALKV